MLLLLNDRYGHCPLAADCPVPPGYQFYGHRSLPEAFHFQCGPTGQQSIQAMALECDSRADCAAFSRWAEGGVESFCLQRATEGPLVRPARAHMEGPCHGTFIKGEPGQGTRCAAGLVCKGTQAIIPAAVQFSQRAEAILQGALCTSHADR